VLLAGATSLPGLGTRLAVGNLFGSNAVDMALFPTLDLVQAGSVFRGLDAAHAASGLFAVVLMALASRRSSTAPRGASE
jgi:hypothetical protein